MADTVVGLEIRANAAEAAKTVGNIKKELKDAQRDAVAIGAAFGELSPQAMQAAKRVAELRDAVADTNERIKLFDPGAKFQVFSNVLNTAAGGFAALTGAAALFGAESEDLQKTLVKVQSALALSQGLSVIADAGKDFQRLGAIAKDALAGIRTGLAATGIGLFVVALGTIVAYWEDIKELVSGVSSEQEKLNDATDANLKAQEEKLETIDSQDNVLKLQGKTEKEILQIKIKQTEEVIAATKQQIENAKITKDLQVKAAERNQKLLKGAIDFFTFPIRTLFVFATDTINSIIGVLNNIPGINIDFKINGREITEAGNTMVAKWMFDPEAVAAEGDAAIAEAEKKLLELDNKRAGFLLSGQAGATGTTKKEAENKELKDREAFLEAQRKMNRESKENEIEEFKEYDKQFQDEKNASAKADREREKEAEQRADTAFQNWKAQQEEADAISKERARQEVAAYQNIGNALSALGDLVGKQTAAGKALAIAQAVINTWLGVTQVLANKTLLPEPLGTINKVASIAGIVAAGIGAVRNIAKTNVPGGGGGGGASVGAIPAPSIPQPQRTTTQLDQTSLNSIGNAVSRSFVVESDVSGSQERIRRLNRAARLN
jgi:hypothetical protein